MSNIIHESPESEHDFSIVRFNEPELEGKQQLEIKTFKGETVGERILFFGFPFGTQHMTSHVGYISADFWHNRTHIFQIDGSINPGNSGGPIIHLPSGSVIGIVTRSETGLEKDFDQLINALKQNIDVLDRSRQSGARISIAGVDPIEATKVTLKILAKLSYNIKRSANVGIGFGFSSEHILGTGLLKQ